METQDLLRAIEQVTGRNLAPLFDQYVWRGGYPQFKVDYTWDPDTKLAKVTIAQTQGEDLLFDLKIPILFGWPDQAPQTFTVRIHEVCHSFYLPLPQKPGFICFDPGNHWLKTVELGFGIPELQAQLLYAPDVISRLYAAQALGKKNTLAALEALKTALHQETFWGVKVGICQALGDLNLTQAIPVLTQALGDPSPHVRKAALIALGRYPYQASTFQTIRQLLEQGDPSYYVESTAAATLGKLLGQDPQRPDPQPLLDVLDQIMATRAGWNEVSRSGVIQAWGSLRTCPAALDKLIAHTEAGIPMPLRLAAIRALGTYASDYDNPRVLETLRLLAQESLSAENTASGFQVQMAVISALGSLSTAKAIPILESLQGADGRLHRAASEAMQRVQSRLGSEQSLQALQQELTTLKQKNQELLSRLEALEAKNQASAPPTPS